MRYQVVTVSEDNGTRIKNSYGDDAQAIMRCDELAEKSRKFPWLFVCVVDSETDKEIHRVDYDDWLTENENMDRVCFPERYPHLM